MYYLLALFMVVLGNVMPWASKMIFAKACPLHSKISAYVHERACYVTLARKMFSF